MIGRGTRLCPDLFGPGRTSGTAPFSTSARKSRSSTRTFPSRRPRARSLRAQLFEERLELVLALDGATGDRDGTHSALGLCDDLGVGAA
jgi:type I restriction enzyme R subunit